MVVYNEIEPYCVEWIRNLVAAGELPAGRVDDRSIADLRPGDVGPTLHAFAGLGGWPLALRMAGWPDDLPVWTGSCPCQPFSTAGRGGGFDDERHLWPDWFNLIRECRPPVVFGEQVASPLGRAWLDAVFADLEGAGYACGAAVLPAAGVGAPHGRHRTYFVAYRTGGELARVGEQLERRFVAGGRGALDIVDVTSRAGGCGREPLGDGRYTQLGRSGANGGPADADCDFASGFGEQQRVRAEERRVVGGSGGTVSMGHANEPRLEGRRLLASRAAGEGARVEASAWSDVEWLECSDGRCRPTQPGIRPLDHGVPSRVGQLRAYGNAIVPQVAAAFIRAAAGAIGDALGVRLLPDGSGV